MAKRFTDSEKWRDPWFCSLNLHNKFFWIYILDNCNHAGIWKVNWSLIKFFISDEFKFNENSFKNRIIKLSREKWFIPKFIDFQYGGLAALNPNNKLHNSVLKILESEGAWKVLARGLEGPKDKYKDKDILCGAAHI